MKNDRYPLVYLFPFDSMIKLHIVGLGREKTFLWSYKVRENPALWVLYEDTCRL